MLVHLVDVSSSSGREPVEDFDVIMRELALFPGRDASGEQLKDKPMVVAANKIDALDDPARLERLRSHVGDLGLPLYPGVCGHRRGRTRAARGGLAGDRRAFHRLPQARRRTRASIPSSIAHGIDEGGWRRSRRDSRRHARSHSRRASRDGACRAAGPVPDACPGDAVPDSATSHTPAFGVDVPQVRDGGARRRRRARCHGL